jgi:hypothetical protein
MPARAIFLYDWTSAEADVTLAFTESGRII